MKYSILGFSQEKVCNIKLETTAKDDKVKVLKLDVNDLLILQVVGDFMNRKKIIKYTIDDKIYFSITYNAIIDDLPILDIKKQALRDRLDKLCLLGLLEKQVIKDGTGSWVAFRLTDLYESLKYGEQKNEGGVYQTTHGGCVSNYTPNNPSTIFPNIDNKDNINHNKEKEIQKKKKGYTQEFEEAWKLYKRKGGKQEAFKRWCALTDKEKELALAHIPFYIQSNDIQFLKDFEGYLNKKYFLRVVRDKKGNTLYDPDQQTDNTYHPITGGALMWNDYYKCYLYTGWYFDGDKMYDGYDDDRRPDGAQIVLNNGRGTLTWNKEQQKWIKK